jgi:dolichol-phosphate mannosyltransferase
VDDGSSDQTCSEVRRRSEIRKAIQLLPNPGPHGFGRAVRYGLSKITGDAVVIVMADGSDSADDVVRYYYVLRDEAECVFGSRFIQGSQVYDYPYFKLTINRLANFFVSVLFRLPCNDITNAFKGYRTEVIRGCEPLIAPHFNLTVEIPLKAFVRGYTFKVIPISWRNRKTGVSSFHLEEQGSRYLYSVLSIWFEHLLTYDDYKRSGTERFVPWTTGKLAAPPEVYRENT